MLEGVVPDGSGARERTGRSTTVRPRPHPLGPEIRLAARAPGRRRARDPGLRGGRGAHPRMGRAKRRQDQDERARDRAELVTDEAKALRDRLEAATGERIEALGAGKAERSTEALHPGEGRSQVMERPSPAMEKTRSDRGMEL